MLRTACCDSTRANMSLPDELIAAVFEYVRDETSAEGLKWTVRMKILVCRDGLPTAPLSRPPSGGESLRFQENHKPDCLNEAEAELTEYYQFTMPCGDYFLLYQAIKSRLGEGREALAALRLFVVELNEMACDMISEADDYDQRLESCAGHSYSIAWYIVAAWERLVGWQDPLTEEAFYLAEMIYSKQKDAYNSQQDYDSDASDFGQGRGGVEDPDS